MYQKSVVVILAVIAISLFMIIVLVDKQPYATFEGDQNTVLDSGVIEPEVVNQGELMSTTDAEVSPQMPQGKIDVRVACESALMYTTFTDGDSAEAYVEECVEGKHPEVIERYISDMGVDGAVI